MSRRLAVAVATAAALCAADAAAQANAKDIFKGKVREGLYEVKSDTDLSGVPGIPKDKARSSETRKRCVTRQEIERGVEPGKDCQMKNYKEAKGTVTGTMECQDGSVTQMKFTFVPDGFASEMRITGNQDGKPFVSVFQSQAKHVGPCPAEAPKADGKPEAKPAPPPAPKK